MLVLAVGLVGLVLLPFLILLAPMLIWFLVPTGVGLALLGAMGIIKRPRRLIAAHS